MIGGGFIGVEVAEQLAKYSDKKVSLVEMEKFCLYYAFSEDVAARADEVIRATNINLFTSSEVKQILGEKHHVKAVLLDDGTENIRGVIFHEGSALKLLPRGFAPLETPHREAKAGEIYMG